MIILRQKEYSSWYKRVLYAMKKGGNKLSNSINEDRQIVGNSILRLTGSSPRDIPRIQYAKPKSKIQIARETLQVPENIKGAAKKVYYTPGQITDKGLEFANENPISAGVGVGSKILMLIEPKTAPIPFGNVALAAEQAAKMGSTRYYDFTKRRGAAYRSSGTSARLRNSNATIPTLIGDAVSYANAHLIPLLTI